MKIGLLCEVEMPGMNCSEKVLIISSGSDTPCIIVVTFGAFVSVGVSGRRVGWTLHIERAGELNHSTLWQDCSAC
jgi:hypothetical protein